MKKILIGIIIIVILLVIGAVALPSLVPSSVYKDKIESQLSQELSRDVRVIGDIKLSVFPVIKANAGRVEIDNPNGFKSEQFAAMDAMSARVKLLPLFSKQVEIASFTLKNPTINLEKNNQGDVNWAFGEPKEKPAKEDTGPFKRDGRFAAVDPSIGKFTLENGTINYSDAVKGESHDLKQVNVDFSLSSLAAPLEIDGDLIYNGTPADIKLSLNSLRAFLDGNEAPLSLALKTDFADISSQGKFLSGEDILFNLDVDGDISDVAKLAALSPVEVPYADLANAIKLSGNYGYDGKILSAKSADINITGSSFNAGFKGGATLSSPPVFDGRVSLDARDVKSLAKALKQDVKGLDLITSANISADLKAQGKGFAANNIDADIKGSDLAVNYAGSAVIGDTITASGNFSANTASVPNLLKAIDQDIPQAAAINNLDARGSLVYSEDLITLTNLDVKTEGGAVSGTYKGDAKITDGTPTLNGQFDVAIPSVGQANQIADLKFDAAKAIGSLAASGKINLAANDVITITELNVKTNDGTVNGSYSGSAKIIDGEPNLNGQFDVDIPSVAQANQLAGLKIDAAKAVGNLNASGTLSLAGKNISITNLAAKTQGDLINGQYSGVANIGDITGYEGTFNTSLTSLTELSKRTGIDVPYAAAIGNIDVKGNVSGQGETLRLSGLSASLTDGQLNGTFTGSAALNDGLNLDGDLRADIPSLRNLAATTGTNTLPPSTEAGAIYERFMVSGKVSGSPAEIAFKSAQIEIDALKGTGDFKIDLTKSKPFMSSTLNMEGLDLRPYMAAYSAQNPTGKIQPWSEAPINTEPLKAIDGNFSLNTPNIITDRMSLGQSNISAKLRGGVMTADLPNMALYGGLGRMQTILDGSGSIPTVSIDMGLDKLESNGFLSAAAGFTNATGEVGSAFKIRGAGRTQAEIMKSLSGGGDFKMLNGQLSGVDLTTLLTGLDQAFTARTLPGGIGASHVTKFKDILGLFTIENGVAKIGKFSLDGAGVLAEGAGQIDLGNQQIDFSLRPRLTGKSAGDLAAFGIPIQVKGGFGNVKIGLDSDLISQIVAERARAKAASLIQKEIGGGLGNIIGGVVGGNQPVTGNSGSGGLGNIIGGVIGGSQAPAQTGSAEQPVPAPKQQDAVTGLLGGLLGVNQTPSNPKPNAQQQPEQPQEPKKEEPKLEDALLSIFGGKKE